MESNGTLTTADPYGIYSDYDEPVLLEENVLGIFFSIFPTVCYSLIFFVSLAGNSFLLWALLKQEDLRQTSSLLLLHLTMSDLIFTVTLPFWAVYVNNCDGEYQYYCGFLKLFMKHSLFKIWGQGGASR